MIWYETGDENGIYRKDYHEVMRWICRGFADLQMMWS